MNCALPFVLTTLFGYPVLIYLGSTMISWYSGRGWSTSWTLASVLKLMPSTKLKLLCMPRLETTPHNKTRSTCGAEWKSAMKQSTDGSKSSNHWIGSSLTAYWSTLSASVLLVSWLKLLLNVVNRSSLTSVSMMTDSPMRKQLRSLESSRESRRRQH